MRRPRGRSVQSSNDGIGRESPRSASPRRSRPGAGPGLSHVAWLPTRCWAVGRWRTEEGLHAATAEAGAEAPVGTGPERRNRDWSRNQGHDPASPAPVASRLRPLSVAAGDRTEEQEVSEVSSLNYCRSFWVRADWLAEGGGAGRPGKRPGSVAAAGAGLKGATSVSCRAGRKAVQQRWPLRPC